VVDERDAEESLRRKKDCFFLIRYGCSTYYAMSLMERKEIKEQKMRYGGESSQKMFDFGKKSSEGTSKSKVPYSKIWGREFGKPGRTRVSREELAIIGPHSGDELYV